MGTLRTKTGNLSFAKYQLQRAILENVLERNYSTADRESALTFFGGCAFCGSPDATRNDHLVPVIKLGDFLSKNVVPACQKCDDSKGKADFRDWMIRGTSPGSLRARGIPDSTIEERLKMIDEHTTGYQPRTEEELFGSSLNQYRDILSKMDALVDGSQKLIQNLIANQQPRPKTARLVGTHSKIRNIGVADSVRRLALRDYVNPARTSGAKEIVIAAADIHRELALENQYPNVCQALKGRKFCQMAQIKLVKVDGPNPSSTTRFTFRIL